MIKIFVDSGSSIKENEKEKYGVEILPLKIDLGGKEYSDGIDLSMDAFYHALIDEKIFPKTSLPSIGNTKEKVQKALEEGYEVLILTISSNISGTFNTLRVLFADEKRVRVVDTHSAVGGIRLLVMEARKYSDRNLDFVEEKVKALIPKIRIIAVPETLDYLQKGGRLSKTAWAFGSLLQLKPLITLDSADGSVKVLGKERGLHHAMRAIANALEKYSCDENYGIVPSYTYNEKNLNTLIELTDSKYKNQMLEYDNLDPAIACHWGPNAFGYIFIEKSK